MEKSEWFLDAVGTRGVAAKVHADELTDMGASAAFIGRGARSIDHLQRISDEAVELWGDASTVATLLLATSVFLGLDYADARRPLDAGARVALATDFNPGTAPEHRMQFYASLVARSGLTLTRHDLWRAFSSCRRARNLIRKER